MKFKHLAFISVLSIGLLCACGGGTSSSNESGPSITTSENIKSNDSITSNVVTSNGGGTNPTTSNKESNTTLDEITSSSQSVTSIGPSNPNYPITNDEGGIISWE